MSFSIMAFTAGVQKLPQKIVVHKINFMFGCYLTMWRKKVLEMEQNIHA